jgi:Protein of unknown function (DUF3631)
MTRKKTVRDRVRALFALMGSDNQTERDTARSKLAELLQKLGKTWNDLPELLQPGEETSQSHDPRDNDDTGPSPYDKYTPVSTVHGMIEQYVALEPHEYLAVSLWCIHTHIFDQFMVTPRLLLSSPVRNCGKSTLLDVMSRLVRLPELHDNITAAVLYQSICELHPTMLLDEADNLELSAAAALRAILNSGHRKGRIISRQIRGEPKKFSTFSPIALASIDTLYPALMSRSIIIHMRRHDNVRPLRLFNLNDTEDLDLVYGHIRRWVSKVVLNTNPDMPVGLRDADNWRPLLAIADACGPEWSVRAREAALALTRADRDKQDVGVTLLSHIREVFDARAVDKLPSQILVDDLIGLENADGMWLGPPRLKQQSLAKMLRPFKIQPKPIWSQARADANNRTKVKAFRGYERNWFEAAWASYCDKSTFQSKITAPKPKKTSARRSRAKRRRNTARQTKIKRVVRKRR